MVKVYYTERVDSRGGGLVVWAAGVPGRCRPSAPQPNVSFPRFVLLLLRCFCCCCCCCWLHEADSPTPANIMSIIIPGVGETTARFSILFFSWALYPSLRPLRYPRFVSSARGLVLFWVEKRNPLGFFAYIAIQNAQFFPLQEDDWHSVFKYGKHKQCYKYFKRSIEKYSLFSRRTNNWGCMAGTLVTKSLIWSEFY